MLSTIPGRGSPRSRSACPVGTLVPGQRAQRACEAGVVPDDRSGRGRDELEVAPRWPTASDPVPAAGQQAVTSTVTSSVASSAAPVPGRRARSRPGHLRVAGPGRLPVAQLDQHVTVEHQGGQRREPALALPGRATSACLEVAPGGSRSAAGAAPGGLPKLVNPFKPVLGEPYVRSPPGCGPRARARSWPPGTPPLRVAPAADLDRPAQLRRASGSWHDPGSASAGSRR